MANIQTEQSIDLLITKVIGSNDAALRMSSVIDV